MEIIEIKNPSGTLIMRHTSNLSNFYGAFGKYQAKQGSFVASARNPHFKSDFSPLPEMLETVNEGLFACGIVQHKSLCDVFVVTRNFHIESGEFVESWAKIPPLEVDPNRYKSLITAVNRYATMVDSNMGADKDLDNTDTSTPNESSKLSKPWINKASVTDANFTSAKAMIEKGEIKNEADLLSKFMISPSVPKLKETILALIK